FVEGLRPEIGQMIKSHLICWQAKPIDEVLRYAKYCSDEIELKPKKLKEKAMVMQIKAAQTGVQGNFVQQVPQQQGNVMFQPQMRGNEEAIAMSHLQSRGTLEAGLSDDGVGGCCSARCLITCSYDGIEMETNSDDEEDQAPETECETTNEEYPLIEFFPMFTVRELHSDLQGTVQENVWDLTGK
ncbi:hypothetical protein NDU88_004629, partial [Pleurodeles waltl]